MSLVNRFTLPAIIWMFSFGNYNTNKVIDYGSFLIAVVLSEVLLAT